MSYGGPFDCLPAHLLPLLTFGTPPSPETRLPSPIVAIRPSGPHSSELLIVQDGRQTVIPLTYGLLVNLLEDATAGIRRCDEAR